MSISNTQETIQALNTEKNLLIAELSSPYSTTAGDWKLVKFLESLVSSDDFWDAFPNMTFNYTKAEMLASINARATKRARINEIEAAITAAEQSGDNDGADK